MCRSGAALRKAQLPLTCKFGDTVEVVVEISPVVERAFLYDPTGDIANLEQLRFEDFSFELVLVSDENEMQDDSDRSTDIAAAVAASVPAELTHCYTALQGWTLKLNSHSCGQRDASTPPLDSESEDSNPTFSLGEEVWVVVEGEHKSKGFVRFMGPIEYMDGIFFGIELTDDSGCNNGTIDGREYFRCPQKHGIFVRPEDVTKGEHMLWPFKRMPIQLSFCGQLEAPSNYNKSVQCSSIFLQAKYGHAVLQSKLWHMPRTPSTSSALTRQTNPVLLDIMPQSSPCAVGLHVAPLCSPGQASFVDVRVSNIHRSSVFQRLLSSTSSGAAVAGVDNSGESSMNGTPPAHVQLRLSIEHPFKVNNNDCDDQPLQETMTLFIVPDDRKFSIITGSRGTHATAIGQAETKEWLSLDDLVKPKSAHHDPTGSTSVRTVTVESEQCVLPTTERNDLDFESKTLLEAAVAKQLSLFQQHNAAAEAASTGSDALNQTRNLATSMTVSIPLSILASLHHETPQNVIGDLVIRVPFYVFNLKGTLLRNPVFATVPKAEATADSKRAGPPDALVASPSKSATPSTSHCDAIIHATAGISCSTVTNFFSLSEASKMIVAKSPLNARMAVRELAGGTEIVCQVFLSNLSGYRLHIVAVDLIKDNHRSTLTEDGDADPAVTNFPKYVVEAWTGVDPNDAMIGCDILPKQHGTLLYRLRREGSPANVASESSTHPHIVFHRLRVQYSYSITDARHSDTEASGFNRLENDQLPNQHWQSLLAMYPLSAAQHFHHFLEEAQQRTPSSAGLPGHSLRNGHSLSVVDSSGYGRSHVAVVNVSVDRPCCRLGELVQITYTVNANFPRHEADIPSTLVEDNFMNSQRFLHWNVECQPERWVVTGTTKAVVPLEESPEQTLSIQLLVRPIQSGWLAVPPVRIFESAHKESDQAPGSDNGCDDVTLLWHPNATKTLKVSVDTGRSTVVGVSHFSVVILFGCY